MNKKNEKAASRMLKVLHEIKHEIAKNPKQSLGEICTLNKVSRSTPSILKELNVIVGDVKRGHIWLNFEPTLDLSKEILECSSKRQRVRKARILDEERIRNEMRNRGKAHIKDTNTDLSFCLSILEILYKKHNETGFNLTEFCRQHGLGDSIKQRIMKTLIRNKGTSNKPAFIWKAGELNLKLAFEIFKNTKFLTEKVNENAQTKIQYELPPENSTNVDKSIPTPASKKDIKVILESQVSVDPRETYLLALIKLSKLTISFVKINLYQFCKENGINDSSRVKLVRDKLIVKKGEYYKWNTYTPTMKMVDMYFGKIREIKAYNKNNAAKPIKKKEIIEDVVQRKSDELPKLTREYQAKLAKLAVYEKAEREGAKPGRETAINDIAEKVNKLILEKLKESDVKFDRLLKQQEHPVNLDEKPLELLKQYVTSFNKFAKEVSENIMLAVTKSDVLEKSITKLIDIKLNGLEFNITKEINPIKYMIVDENAKMRKEIEALRTKEATVIETTSYFWGLYKTTKTQK